MDTLFSKLYIFKQYQCLPEYLSHMYLHSNLVIFKLTYIPTGQKIYFLYIPIWLYSNSDRHSVRCIAIFLYIPIWLYSNEVTNYGRSTWNTLYIPIWLYSNRIDLTEIFPENSLHSNLVIFKWIPQRWC